MLQRKTLIVIIVFCTILWVSPASASEPYDFKNLFKVKPGELLEAFEMQTDPSTILLSILLIASLWTIASLTTINREVNKEIERIAEIEDDIRTSILAIAPIDVMVQTREQMDLISKYKDDIVANNEKIKKCEEDLRWIEKMRIGLKKST